MAPTEGSREGEGATQRGTGFSGEQNLSSLRFHLHPTVGNSSGGTVPRAIHLGLVKLRALLQSPLTCPGSCEVQKPSVASGLRPYWYNLSGAGSLCDGWQEIENKVTELQFN